MIDTKSTAHSTLAQAIPMVVGIIAIIIVVLVAIVISKASPQARITLFFE